MISINLISSIFFIWKGKNINFSTPTTQHNVNFRSRLGPEMAFMKDVYVQ